MRQQLYTLALAAASLAPPAGAAAQQLPRPGSPDFTVTAADLASDAARRCADSHIGAAAQRLATSSVAHRALMERYDVKYYKLDLAMENTTRDVSGSVWMRVQARSQGLDSLGFELYQAPAGSAAGSPTLTIDRITINGVNAPGIRRRGYDAAVRLPQPAAAGTLVDAVIYYHGTAPRGNSAAIGNALSTTDTVRVGTSRYPYHVTWSLSEPYSAHEWFPCKQVLTDKADSSDVWITTTLPNKVGSNGVLVRTTPLPNNRVRYEWKSRHPIAYYLISVAIAPYLEYVNYANPAGSPRVPIVNYVYDQRALSFYQAEIDRTPGFIENFSTLVGLYPFANEKYGHAMAPLGGGMEHQTMTTQDGFDFTLTAHELFHQWFGDNVTCASWEDIWLNESFASYGEYLSLQAFSTPAAARAWMNTAHQYAQFSNGSVYVPDTTNVNRIFNYLLSYKKGAGVVHTLRFLLNDDTKFFRALRTYQQQFGNSTARTADMQRVFEAEAGRPLGYFFQQWFRGRGYPSFQVRWNQVGSTFTMRVTEQVTEPTLTPFFDTDVEYRLNFANGTNRTVRVHQGQPVVGIDIPTTSPVVSIDIDPNQWIMDQGSSSLQDSQLPLGTAAARATLVLAPFPNPCRDVLQLGALPAARLTAEALDATGRRVLRQELDAAHPQLDTHALAPGLYHLRLLSPGGEVLAQSRFARE